MKIVININTDNAAFEENDSEMMDVLSQMINGVTSGRRDGTLRDSNGNTVGKFIVKGK
jgi:hypothetical protein